MGRQRGLEGSVRERPPGSGRWQGRLPTRLDPYRRAIAGTYTSQRACRAALNAEIADLDRKRTSGPVGKPGQPVRRLSDVITDYIADRSSSGRDPIAIRTARDYRDLLKNTLGHPRANIAHTPSALVDSPSLDSWVGAMHTAGISEPRAKKAFALVRAALAWEVRQGRLAVNPAREVRRVTTKAGRARRAKADPVLLPSWKEAADLAAHPDRLEDRLLVATLEWSGMRWSEAISLSVADVWSDVARLSVTRVFTWDEEAGIWVVEVVKGGNPDVVPVPEPLWTALRKLADARDVTEDLGGDLLFRPTRLGHGRRPTIVVDHSNFTKRVWYPARAAAGLDGDETRTALDPRRRGIHIKDLRAYAASVIVDAGGTIYDAARLLRHADIATTNRFYARAQSEQSRDPARAAFRADLTLSLEQRIDALWNAWSTAQPDLVERITSIALDNE